MWGKFVQWAVRPKWIVGFSEDDAELGIRIMGVNFYYYKWPEPMLADYPWKYAVKREFGESIKSVIRNNAYSELQGE